MEDKKKIVDFLVQNEIDNVNVVNFIESYPIHYIKRIGDSVIVKGRSDREWVYISSKSEEEVHQIKGMLDCFDKNFAIIEEWMIPILSEGNKIKWKLSTMKLILPDDIPALDPKHEVSQLTTEDASFIYENSDYKEFLSIEYVTERITNGINTCIRYKDKPIAWAITQDDGAIGFLHVLPEYRKMGYARDVMINIISKVRDKSKIPFVHIDEENESSMRLATGLGFKKYKLVSWFEIE